MPVALRTLAVGEKALRHDQMQAVLGARHRDVEQPALLLDFRCCSGTEIGGNTAVDDIEHEDGPPFLSLGGMNRREDQVVLIQQRHPGLIARGLRRVERQLRQETRPRRIASGDLLELQQVGLADRRIFMNALKVGLIPATRMAYFRWPARFAGTNRLQGLARTRPSYRRPAEERGC